MGKVAWIVFGAIVVAVLGGLIIFSRLNSPTIDVSSVDAQSIISASDQNGNIGDHVFGVSDGKVLLIEYGDFQCPGCAGVHPTLKAISEEYEEKIGFIFRNFPLTTIHPNARAAAAAVEAAGLQGKYWEMHNMIFDNKASWENLTGNDRTNQFVSFAAGLGLDEDTFKNDLGSSNVNQKISFDQALGKKLGVDSTPTIYLNGEALDEETRQDLSQGEGEKLRALIDEAIAEQQ